MLRKYGDCSILLQRLITSTHYNMEVMMSQNKIKIDLNNDELCTLSAILKFMIKHFYQDKIDDPIYLEMNSLRSKLINAKQK